MTKPHPANTEAMFASPRCGAKTRARKPCKSPAVHGKKRCRMHGGAEGSGAPKGNTNALKHGRFTREAIQRRKFLREQVQRAQKFARSMDS
jgi:glucans biosynthesis protein